MTRVTNSPRGVNAEIRTGSGFQVRSRLRGGTALAAFAVGVNLRESGGPVVDPADVRALLLSVLLRQLAQCDRKYRINVCDRLARLDATT